ncbi:hypothetical protein [Exiguobacterium indicum]|uniref:hypothetical protein n=1 Tax=Exiguobacterium indicum TaxID=296995 RepID=UPI003315080A
MAQFLLFPHVEGEVLEGNLLSGVDCVIQGFHDVIDFLVVCLDAVLNIHVSHELFCVVETRERADHMPLKLTSKKRNRPDWMNVHPIGPVSYGNGMRHLFRFPLFSVPRTSS